MIPFLVLAGCLTLVIVTGRAIRNAPVECDQCIQLIPADEWDEHVAQHGLPVVDADPPVSAARQAHPANGDDAVIDDLEQRLHLPWHWQEDRAARRTQLTEDGE